MSRRIDTHPALVRRPAAVARPASVLVVDEDDRIIKAWRVMLEVGDGSPAVLGALDADRARRLMAEHPVDVVVADVRLGATSGLDLLAHIKRSHPAVEVIIMSGHGRFDDAVRATKAGAFDYITKPFVDIGDVVARVHKAIDRKRLNDQNEALHANDEAPSIFHSRDARMRRLLDQVQRAAVSERTLLLVGPVGVGKTTLARAAHDLSKHAAGPFVTLNAAESSPELLRSALTGAAPGGTLCLEQVDGLAKAGQAALHDVLEHQPERLTCRLISTAHTSPAYLIDNGQFREDLYWLLNGVEVELPPLNERRADVPHLAHAFLRRACDEAGLGVRSVDPALMDFLVAHDWRDGNLRALERAMAQAALTCSDDTLTLDALPARMKEGPDDVAMRLGELVDLDRPWKDAISQAEHVIRATYLRGLLERAEGNMTRAAEWAGLDRSNFRRHVKKYLNEEER
ncbi:MAG: sigma-54-dependent Fis family transcriptional regulator [Myxococcales bacterium]|nr:sigma-54-dependent Fis family transcriptional regulator [Myxococcales bacterium]MCB9525292.1 sigma-54-dependent Fis family transcriptional regulator [Myxococcales bacterium]